MVKITTRTLSAAQRTAQALARYFSAKTYYIHETTRPTDSDVRYRVSRNRRPANGETCVDQTR